MFLFGNTTFDDNLFVAVPIAVAKVEAFVASTSTYTPYKVIELELLEVASNWKLFSEYPALAVITA